MTNYVIANRVYCGGETAGGVMRRTCGPPCSCVQRLLMAGPDAALARDCGPHQAIDSGSNRLGPERLP